jgi:hypothetical protein
MTSTRKGSRLMTSSTNRIAEGLIAGIIDFKHPDSRTVIDGCELIQALSGACNALEELHVQLQAVPGLWLLVALPGSPRGPTLLVGWQAVYPVADQDAVHRGAGDAYAVKATQIVGDLSGPEVIVLAQIQNLGNNLAGRCPRRSERYTRTVA